MTFVCTLSKYKLDLISSFCVFVYIENIDHVIGVFMRKFLILLRSNIVFIYFHAEILQ